MDGVGKPVPASVANRLGIVGRQATCLVSSSCPFVQATTRPTERIAVDGDDVRYASSSGTERWPPTMEHDSATPRAGRAIHPNTRFPAVLKPSAQVDSG